mmetsp:Transcript_4353/g.10113  ORF Transcript_4353/g.10113 Transcript_4353/m.10113 type:complete len:216 (-) Transcript_4353:1996-2643(-)
MRSSLHGSPPKRSFSRSLVRMRFPDPQEVEQLSQSLQSPSLQSTGHGASEHSKVSVRLLGHGTPPNADSTWAILNLRLTPPPQVVEHPDQGDQSVTTQSTGHCTWLQAASWNDSPVHAAPPSRLGSRTVRCLVMVPPPQVTVQPVQGLHSSNWQSTGQVCVLQRISSFVAPTQGSPPLACWVTMDRLLVAAPPPQVSLQLVKPLQSPKRQSTGQR